MSIELIVLLAIIGLLLLLVANALWSGDSNFTREVVSPGNGESHDEYHARRR